MGDRSRPILVRLAEVRTDPPQLFGEAPQRLPRFVRIPEVDGPIGQPSDFKHSMARPGFHLDGFSCTLNRLFGLALLEKRRTNQMMRRPTDRIGQFHDANRATRGPPLGCDHMCVEGLLFDVTRLVIGVIQIASGIKSL